MSIEQSTNLCFEKSLVSSALVARRLLVDGRHTMSCLLSSHGLVVATAMVVSTTAFFLAFSRQKTFPPTQFSENPDTDQKPNGQPFRSCLCTEEKKRERKAKKKKKKVQFADNVKKPSGNVEELSMHKDYNSEKVPRICRGDIPTLAEYQEMPANRIALYNGILRDRVHRMECSY